jgi:hypothetical protein
MGDSWEDQADELVTKEEKSSSFSFNPKASSFSFNPSASSFAPPAAQTQATEHDAVSTPAAPPSEKQVASASDVGTFHIVIRVRNIASPQLLCRAFNLNCPAEPSMLSIAVSACFYRKAHMPCDSTNSYRF